MVLSFAHTGPIFKDITILSFYKQLINMLGLAIFKLEYELFSKSVIPIFSDDREFLRMTQEIEIYKWC